MVDTFSPYRSPVRLVLHAAEATAPFSAQALSRARKKMMAEIALGGDEIVIDDVPYSRNDAATLLDDISEEAWRVHCIVYTHPGLLQFLEKQAFDNEELRKADPYRYDLRLVNVVSPFFAYSFNSVSGSLLRQSKWDSLLLLLNYQTFILPGHQHEAFQKLRTYLDELSYTLRNLSWERFIADETILHFVFEDDWQKSMNALPPSFNTLRDEIVTHLIEIVLRFQQKATWYYLHQVLVNLRALDTNEFNRAEINRIDEVIYANTQLESKGKSRAKDGSWTRGVFWGIWIILMIVRGATCNGYDDGDDDNNGFPSLAVQETDRSNVTEKKNEKLLMQRLDSLLKKPFAPKNSRQQRLTASAADVPGPAFLFSEHPSAARNDSVQVVNKTPYDAVFLYFKDIPGHALSGRLPKLYSAVIKKGTAEKLYVLAGNGRVYFAFGEDWTEVAQPVLLPFPGQAMRPGFASPLQDSLPVLWFFRNGRQADQPFLRQPLYINRAGTLKEYSRYRYFNTSVNHGQSTLYLSATNGRIELKADGPLLVKTDRKG